MNKGKGDNMKNLILICSLALSFTLGLTACGGGSGGGAKSTNGQPANYNPNNNQVTTIGPGVVITPGPAVSTPYSTGRSFNPEGTVGAEFYKDTTGVATLVQGDMSTIQPTGYAPDCLIPAGNYALSTSQGGQQGTKEHHYNGIVIDAVGPVSFKATIITVSAKPFTTQNGVWKLQGVFRVSTVGNRSCTNFGLPIDLSFTF